MNTQTIAIIIQEGSKIVGEVIRNGGLSMFHRKEEPKPVSQAKIVTADYSVKGEKATATATGCLPCAIGHLGTCSGLLNEATRFARKDGIGNDEVIDRMNMCLDELNTFERVDLRPEMIDSLPENERDMARQALDASRDIRHILEGIEDSSGLEHADAERQRVRMDIGKQYLKDRIAKLTPEKKEQIKETLMEKLKEAKESQETVEISDQIW